MNYLVILLALCFFKTGYSAESVDTRRFYFLKPGYRLNSTQYTWTHNVIGFKTDSLPRFEISSGNVTLVNEVLLKTNWEFSLDYWGSHPGVSGPSDRLTLRAKYRRTGPLGKCENRGYPDGNFIENDEWVDTWDLIAAQVKIVLQSDSTKSVVLPAKFSERPDNDRFTVKNPGENGCRNVYENTLAWWNVQSDIQSAFVGSPQVFGIDKLSFDFEIQFISQTDNEEEIRKYNANVAVTKK